MATYKIFKETALPGTLDAHSIYLIAPPGNPNFVEMYVTGALASTVKRVINTADVQALITTALASAGNIQIVANIPARNALTLTNALTVLVRDATGDATVVSGAATYVYDLTTTTWIKVSEYESLDVSLTWAALTGKPTSSAASIDTAVSQTHTHANKTQLDKIGETGGLMTYNGTLPHVGWDSTGW